MPTRQHLGEPVIVSFSGLDGSGKTTQIAALREAISQLGLTSELLTFWDDVVVGSRWRMGFVHKVFGSEIGVGAPGRPVDRRDKNVRVGYLTLLRHILYLADAVYLRTVLRRARLRGSNVILIDRYIYDELANLPLENHFTSAYVRLVARIAPRPELAFLLDTDPVSARSRKPEYSLNFMSQSRLSYFRLVELLGNLTVIPTLALQDATNAVLTHFLRCTGRSPQQSDPPGAAHAA